MTEQDVDALILGSGIIGLTTACYIKEQNPDHEVLIIDRLSAPGDGSTKKSAAAFRYAFSSETNRKLVMSTIERLRSVQKQGTNLGINWAGYLWLFDEPKFEELQPVLSDMEKKGLKIDIYEPSDLKERIKLRTQFSEDEEAKMMHLKPVDKGVFIHDAGFLDVDRLVEFYKSYFERLGGKIQYNTRVDNIKFEAVNSTGMSGEPFFWQERRVAGVQTNRGPILAKTTIIAAGAWTSLFLNQASIPQYVYPKKRQIFSIKADTEELLDLLFVKSFNQENCDPRCLPFTILPDGTYIRPNPGEKTFWTCHSDKQREIKYEDDPQPEENYYKFGVYQVLSKYFSQFRDRQPFSAFAGLYEYTEDGQPLISKQNGLLIVAGANGSGIMKSDAIGRIGAGLYSGQEYVMLYGGTKFKVSDLSLGKDRNVEVEKMVI